MCISLHIKCKGKLHLLQELRLCTGLTAIGGVQVQLYTFLTPALEGAEGSESRPGRSLSRERPDTHCTGDWVGPRAGLDKCGKSRPHRDSIPDLPARSQSLYRLSYPAYGLHLKYPLFLFNFNKTSNFSTVFRKQFSKTKFHENLSSGRLVVPCGQMDGGRTDRRRDMMWLIVAFPSFAKAPNQEHNTETRTWSEYKIWISVTYIFVHNF